ncbi:MAG: flagellar biosynthetic protein FliO [Gammaproteobacteria bacterium]
METEYWHMLFNLLGVLALMLALFFLLKKLKITKKTTNKHIKIINVMPIGSKEKIMLIEVNKMLLLIGATPSHIETLYVFSDIEEVSQKSESDQFKKFMEATNLSKEVSAY